MSKISMRDLAKLCGVSPSTVSIVLNNKKGVSEETRRRVLIESERHGYSLPKRKISTKKNVLLLKFYKTGMFVEENQGFITMIINAIEDQLRRENYGMTTYAANQDLKQALASVDYSEYCGVIIIATEMLGEDYALLREIPISFVVVDNTVPGHKYTSVCMNNRENVWYALNYCKDSGHLNLGYLGSKAPAENFNERYAAFKEFTGALDIEFTKEHEFRVTPTLVGAHNDFGEILKDAPSLPSCFFAENDTIALGVMKALQEAGYRIPNDVSIIGFDDIPYASVSLPALTTIHVQRDVIGRLAVFHLLSVMSNTQFSPVKTVVTGDLQIRDSVKRID